MATPGARPGGRLDRRLFDVAALLDLGYDDTRRGDMPLIVRYATAAPPAETWSRMSAWGGAVEVGSDSPQMLALHLGMLDLDLTDAPELAEHLRTLADRYRRAAGPLPPATRRPSRRG